MSHFFTGGYPLGHGTVGAVTSACTVTTAGGSRYLGGIQLRRGRRSPGLESVDRPLGSAEHNPIMNE